MGTDVMEGAEDMSGEGTDYIGSESTFSPVAGKHVIVYGATGFVRVLAPGSISPWEETLNCSGTGGPGKSLKGFGVEVVGRPRWGRWAGFGRVRSTIKETVAVKAEAAKRINCEGKYLSICVVESCDVGNGGATKL